MALLIDVSTASPPYVLSQTAAAAGLKQRMGGGAVIGRMIDAAASRSGITTRRVVVPDAEPDVQEPFYALSPEGPHPDTARRMDLYRQWSARLAVEACSTLLEKTGTAPASVDRLITVSCTGWGLRSLCQLS